MPSHLLATVFIPIIEPLQTCGARLAAVLDGVAFVAEETGRYEEVPAYVGSNGNAEFILFGVPDGESADEYSLQFSCTTEMSLRRLVIDSGISFLARVPTNKPVNGRGFVDVSLELCAHLNDADFGLGEAVITEEV